MLLEPKPVVYSALYPGERSFAPEWLTAPRSLPSLAVYLERDHDGMVFEHHQDFDRSSVRQQVKRVIASTNHRGNREHALVTEPSQLVLKVTCHHITDLAGSVPQLWIGLLRFHAQHLRSHKSSGREVAAQCKHATKLSGQPYHRCDFAGRKRRRFNNWLKLCAQHDFEHFCRRQLKQRKPAFAALRRNRNFTRRVHAHCSRTGMT